MFSLDISPISLILAHGSAVIAAPKSACGATYIWELGRPTLDKWLRSEPYLGNRWESDVELWICASGTHQQHLVSWAHA